MILWELYQPEGELEVELSPEIKLTFWRHIFRIQDTFDDGGAERDRRVARALAFIRLRPYVKDRTCYGEPGITVKVAQDIAASLGELIDWALSWLRSSTPTTATVVLRGLPVREGVTL
jgi:hypothetical protein